MQGATELHILDQVGSLALIRSNDANLIRLCSSFQQPCGDFFHISCFSPAETIWSLLNFLYRYILYLHELYVVEVLVTELWWEH